MKKALILGSLAAAMLTGIAGCGSSSGPATLNTAAEPVDPGVAASAPPPVKKNIPTPPKFGGAPQGK